MVISRDLSLKVITGICCNVKNFYIGEDISILTKYDEVFVGILKDINLDNLIIETNTNDTIVYFKDIEKIEDTDWLGGEDIR